MSMLVIAVFFYSIFLWDKGDIGLSSRAGGLIKHITKQKETILLVIAAGCVFFGVFSLHMSGRAILKRIGLSALEHSRKIIKNLMDAASIYCKRPVTILMVLGLTVVLQIIVIISFWVLGVNMGIEASLRYYCVFFPLTWVLGALPLSIGGTVVVEGMLVYLFVQFTAVGAESALALALCQRLVWMIISLPGAGIHLMGYHLPKDLSTDYQ